MGVENIWKLVLVDQTKLKSKGVANTNDSTFTKVKDA